MGQYLTITSLSLEFYLSLVKVTKNLILTLCDGGGQGPLYTGHARRIS